MNTRIESTEASSDVARFTERQARIAWSLIAEPGDRMANALIAAHHGDAAAALVDALEPGMDRQPDGTADEIVSALERWRARAGAVVAQVAIVERNAARLEVAVLIPGDAEWPTEKLARLGDYSPLVLYVRGDRTLLARSEHAVAIVGARAATGYGEHVAIEIASAMVEQDVTIVSGGAYGIDGAAHRATLATGGRTIAVLPGGVDRFYPAGNDALLSRIAAVGAIVSELPLGAAPTKWRFLQRNRIIAALSDVVLVVEAADRSGSLNTAGHARQIGVPVAAVPGPVTSAASAGTHRLIREGATLVTHAAEVAELFE